MTDNIFDSNIDNIDIDANGLSLESINFETLEVSKKFEPKQIELKQTKIETIDTKEAKPERLLCLNKLSTGVEGEDPLPCKRKAVKGTSYCKKCSKDKEEQQKKIEIEQKELSGKAVTVNALFGMHYAMYLNLQFLSQFNDINLDGLPQDLLKDREEFIRIYEQIYDQYGSEALEQYVGPAYALALMSAGQIGNRFMLNKKQILKKE